MQYKSVKGFTGWAQLGFLFAFLGLGFILAGGAQWLLCMQILPAGAQITDKTAMMNALLNPANLTMARIIQVSGTLLLLFVPALLWSFVSNGKGLFWLGFNKYINWRQALLGFLIIFTAAFVASPLEDLTKYITGHFPSFDAMAKQMEDEYDKLAITLSAARGWTDYIIALFIMAFFPAVFEETFFRGVLQNLLVKWLRKPVVAILITSIIFSLVHFSVYLFASRFILGFALGWMFYETKNIWVNIIAHFINNAFALSLLFFSDSKAVHKDMDHLDPHVSPFGGILAALVVTGMFIFLRNYSARNKARVQAKENFLIAAADPYRAIAATETDPDGI